MAVPRQQLAALEISACSPGVHPYEITDARVDPCLRWMRRGSVPSSVDDLPSLFSRMQSYRVVAATVAALALPVRSTLARLPGGAAYIRRPHAVADAGRLLRP